MSKACWQLQEAEPSLLGLADSCHAGEWEGRRIETSQVPGWCWWEEVPVEMREDQVGGEEPWIWVNTAQCEGHRWRGEQHRGQGEGGIGRWDKGDTWLGHGKEKGGMVGWRGFLRWPHLRVSHGQTWAKWSLEHHLLSSQQSCMSYTLQVSTLRIRGDKWLAPGPGTQ